MPQLFHTEELSNSRTSTSNKLEQENSCSVQTQSRTLPPTRPLVDSRMDDILQELRQANSPLTDVTNRLDMVEGQLKGLEKASTCSTSTGSEQPVFKEQGSSSSSCK